MLPAHCRKSGLATTDVKDSMPERSFRSHVLPMEKVPFAFSLDLCTRTLPDFRTATTMTRGFWDWGVRAWGGGGLVG